MIGITIGDPGGIGPEVVVKALENFEREFVVIGSKDILEFYGKILHLNKWRKSEILDPYPGLSVIPGKPHGRLSFEYLRRALKLLDNGGIKGLVTGPISKRAWVEDGINFLGHTDFFEKKYRGLIMGFWSEGMKVALFTHHLSLSSALLRVKKGEFEFFVKNLKSSIEKFFPGDEIICSSVNPHAGEGGEMGCEELDVIKPVIEKYSIKGPYPSDTVFLVAEKEKKWVISFFHDIGLAPFKLLHFYDGAEITLGLPWVRTSPCHGTAYEIAGKGVANEGSMKTAISLAIRLVY